MSNRVPEELSPIEKQAIERIRALSFCLRNRARSILSARVRWMEFVPLSFYVVNRTLASLASGLRAGEILFAFVIGAPSRCEEGAS